jgi:hypothetical protein
MFCASREKLPSALKKAQWALLYSDDVAKLRRKLADKTASLNDFSNLTTFSNKAESAACVD